MKKNSFFANAVRTILALVAVVMVSLAFTACSKDSDDDSKFTNTATINGKQVSIVRNAMYQNTPEFARVILLLADDEGRIELVLDHKAHLKGKPISLDKKEVKHEGQYWRIEYYHGSNNINIKTSGNPDDDATPVFETGTLIATTTLPETSGFSISLKNGRVKDFDDDSKTHNISFSFSGPAMPKR